MKKLKNLILSVLALLGAFLLLFPNQLFVEAEDSGLSSDGLPLIHQTSNLDTADIIVK